MPNMFGGDQFDEDYAPTAYVNHIFVGFEKCNEFKVGKNLYRFSTELKKIEVEVNGSKIKFKNLSKNIKKRILKKQKNLKKE